MSDTPKSNVTMLPNGSLPAEGASSAVISTLEDFLADARAGKLAGVAIAAVYTDDNVDEDMTTGWAKGTATDKSSRLLGAVTILQSRLVAWVKGDPDA